MGYRLRKRRSRHRVMTALCRMAEGGTVVRASSREIATFAEVSHWTVQSALADLESAGAIIVIRRGQGTGGARPGTYRLTATNHGWPFSKSESPNAAMATRTPTPPTI